MPIHRDKRYKQFTAALKKSVEVAVAKSAIIVQKDIKLELSKPGTGRFYARHNRTRQMSTMDHDELSVSQVTEILHKENSRVAKINMRGRRNVIMRPLRSLGIHRASAPGQPPAVDTGHLRRSIQPDLSGVKERNPRARVGTNVQYAPGLEYGTRRVAKRPFMRPAARKARPKIAAFWSARQLVRDTVQRVTFGGTSL